MDKLNGFVKAGIFVDKNNDGFTKAEQKALGEEFIKLHNERGDAVDFRKMLAGKSFDYKDEEFIRLAQAAGYVLAENPEKVSDDKKVDEVKEVKEVEKPQETQVKEEPKPIQQNPSTPAQPKVELTEGEKEIASLKQELDKMKESWTEEDLKYPDRKLTEMMYEISREISTLEKDYKTETVTKKRFMRKDTTEKVKVPKTEEEIAADKAKIEAKKAELDKIAKLKSVETLYASDVPTKYAGEGNIKFISRVVTTKDGRKLGVATVRKPVYNKIYGREVETYVDEYYPVSLQKYEERETVAFPQYYYGVDKDAQAVQGKIELYNGKVVQE